jgi:hypothetical protein
MEAEEVEEMVVVGDKMRSNNEKHVSLA